MTLETKEQICENCDDDESDIFELSGSKCCEDCWLEYFRDNELYMNQSFEEFKMGLRKVKKK